ncbi:MAG: heme ABC transporter ATP-binding protein [Pseudomonadota bacterium]
MTLHAEGISVVLGDKVILDAVDLIAPVGQVTAVCGPNGSGKSTLLRAVTGDIAHGGRVTLNGQDITALPPWVLSGTRGVLAQHTSLAFPFKVFEVVRMGLTAGTAATEPEIVPAALSRVGLGNYGDRFYHDLSGGEAQRVQLARVLAQIWYATDAGTPRWLFLDEPVASLDIAHQLAVMEIARSYAKQGGGVVAVMHDLNLTAMFADHMMLLKEGRVQAAGTPRDVMTDDILRTTYDCPVRVGVAPAGEVPWVLPHAAAS